MARISLKDISTKAPGNFDKKETKALTAELLKELSDLQNLLYAGNEHALLIVLQGMDASGKDGVIRDVLSFMNPQGVAVSSFKVPTEKELSHDFLWRIHEHAPARRMIQVFNRSHYEDVLVTRVHKLIDDDTARRRMNAINDFERLLTQHNSTQILKFYLHVSREEQAERLKERKLDPKKMWKYSGRDDKEASKWEDYARVYEDCFEHCNEPEWIIVPSDQNWYKEYVVARAIRDKLTSLGMKYPHIEEVKKKEESSPKT
jgi:PPK2 family polyphosphate:nucleotide phosphotransferase